VATLEGPSALAASVTVIAAAPVELLPLEAPPASAAEPAKADHSATIREVAELARDPFGNPVGNLRCCGLRRRHRARWSLPRP